MRRRPPRPLALAPLLLALGAPLASAPLASAAAPVVPPALEPWKAWVLRDAGDALCPQLGTGTTACAWPARLNLALDDRGGTFEQVWTVWRRTGVSLPAQLRGHIPLDVRVDGRPAAALEGLFPYVLLDPGTHVVTGQFTWSSLPSSLYVPPQTGLLTVRLRGVTITPPRDVPGAIALAGQSATAAEADTLSLAVHRLLVDETPFEVTTRILLDVAGAARELTLGPVMLEGAIPIAIDSPIPARLEADGRLRLQVRPGSWTVAIRARQPGPVSRLAPPAAQPPWPDREIWAFDARPSLRVVSLEGAPALDPHQTATPAEWKGLPTFRMDAATTLTLDEKRRGDAEPPADALTLARTLSLDFDGSGFTAVDTIGGTLRRSWRLDTRPPLALGRATVAGQAQLLTVRPAAIAAGFEIREGAVDVRAESRIERSTARIAATGWDAEFESLSTTLRLPPGWRLWHATGVDRADGSWLDRWTLLDLFLALIVAIAAARIWGRGTGALAFAVMVLTIPEGGAPRWAWLPLLALAAIEIALPRGRRPRQVVAFARGAWAVALVMASSPFLVQQARQALHPQLEAVQPWHEGDARQVGLEPAMAGAPPAAPMEMKSNAVRVDAEIRLPQAPGAQVRTVRDVRDLVQTGPGVPEWTWRSHELIWSGPVARDQEVRLLLLPPIAMRLLSAITLLLLMGLLLRAIVPPDWPLRSLRTRMKDGDGAPPTPDTGATAASLACLLAAVLMGATGARASDIPSPELLGQLRAHLLERAPCGAACGSIGRASFEVQGQTLVARLEVTAAADTAIPLPGSLSQWSPESVMLDGRPAGALLRERDTLWLLVSTGKHQVDLAGALPDTTVVSVPLPLRPARVEVRAAGWLVTGVRDGIAAETLQLTRERPSDGATAREDQLSPSSLPPFVRVRREISLELTFQVRTRVETLAPTTSPVVLAIPLLAGEAVTSEDVRVEDGRALVNLGPGTRSVSWTGTLPDVTSLELVASESTAWSETWTLEASPRWHVEWAGIPPVHAPEIQAIRVPEWRPWPGERVTLAIAHPDAAPGSFLTTDRVSMAISPGRRATSVAMQATLRTSRGGEHAIGLPAGATVESLAVNGLAQPVRMDDGVVMLPITPGETALALTWREDRGTSVRFASPPVELGPAVNVSTTITVPQDRWVLWVSGPILGPAVLFWPLLGVLLLLALGLARIPGTPLRLHDWVLLLIGLSQVSVAAATAVIGWLLVLAHRRGAGRRAPWAMFDLVQILVVLGAAVTVGVLFAAINQGLLGRPDMQVQGNHSSGALLQWTADRASGALPECVMWSAPLLVYRIAMLLWALWLAAALVRWMRWAWESFLLDGAWRKPTRKPRAEAARPEVKLDETP